MAQLLYGKIDVTKIDKDRLYKGKKGTYLDLAIWINDKADDYGNTVSIQQSTKQGEPKIYLGNGKEAVKKEPEFEGPPDDQDDLPF